MQRITQSSRFNWNMFIDRDNDGSMIICEILITVYVYMDVWIYWGKDGYIDGWINGWMDR